ncbi:DUF4383 domain-containing protein [Arthrobacter sp. H14]|uniref:DUF4383 domain-containing protein n=1 Tax=Arthrobacter sp. H14 TaxID=1312959 RepID=UPI0009E06845|nr:DUF4383 domain-containing protein [Arthrobacter sp. H14]
MTARPSAIFSFALPKEFLEETTITGPTSRHLQRDRTTIQKASLAIGAVFLLVGVLGFIPGITTNYGALQLAGHESKAMLLDVFQVSVLHNLVHLLYGVAGIVLAKTVSGARTYLIVGGVIYLLLWLYGLLSSGSAANFVPLNGADNWLHLGLGLGMTALALLLTTRTTRADKAH